jgi:hypothetical protein
MNISALYPLTINTDIFRDGLRQIKILPQDIRYSGRDLAKWSPEYESLNRDIQYVISQKLQHS